MGGKGKGNKKSGGQQQQQKPQQSAKKEELNEDPLEQQQEDETPLVSSSSTTTGGGPSPKGSNGKKQNEPEPSLNLFLRFKQGAALREFVPPASTTPPSKKPATATAAGGKHVDPTSSGAEASSSPSSKMNTICPIDESKDMRDCLPVFSQDGTTMVYASTEDVTVSRSTLPAPDASAETLPLLKIDEPRVTELQLSPQGTYLVTYRPHDAHSEETKGNMSVWRLKNDDDEDNEEEGDKKEIKGGAGTEVLRAVQAVWPCMEWSADEKFAVRQLQQRLMVHDGAFASSEALSKVELSFPRGKEASFAVSPSEATPFVTVFRPQTKVGTQATCQVYRLPHLTADSPVMQHSFGKGDSAKMTWNSAGSAFTAVVNCAADTSHQSYYGTTTLFIVHVKDKKATQIKLAEKESIHDCKWSPTADELIVVHGVMPHNKATLYNGKGEAVYAFGESPRNLIKWSPNGKFFVMGGTGGMNGDFQFYCRENVGKRGPLAAANGGPDGKLGFFSEKSTIQMWSPCSRYFLCANVFRLLRLSNKFVMWKHTGERLMDEAFPGELHGIDWIPTPHKLYKARAPSPTKTTATAEDAKPKAYRPPGGGSSTVANMLNRPTSGSVGGAVKPKPKGPIGGAVVETKKKKK